MGTTFGFEPTTLRPERFPDASCVAQLTFATRIIIIVADGAVVRGLRFRFTDRFGVNGLPRVLPIPGSSPLTVPASTIPQLSPLPLPGVAPLPSTSPIPFPGASPVNPAGGSRQLAFLLWFDCGIAPAGTLVVTLDVAEPGGTLRTPEFRVTVGS